MPNIIEVVDAPWMEFELDSYITNEKAQRKQLKISKLKERALSFIHNNEISELNPYTIMVSTAGQSIGAVTLAVVKTDGITLPPKMDYRCKALLKIIQKWVNVNVGTTPRSAFQRYLPSIIALRDHMNLCHRVKLGKQIITEELMKSVTDPKLKQKLIEAVCLAAI
jgi:hypothetical protein